MYNTRKPENDLYHCNNCEAPRKGPRCWKCDTETFICDIDRNPNTSLLEENTVLECDFSKNNTDVSNAK